jgi:hypothetical protein
MKKLILLAGLLLGLINIDVQAQYNNTLQEWEDSLVAGDGDSISVSSNAERYAVDYFILIDTASASARYDTLIVEMITTVKNSAGVTVTHYTPVAVKQVYASMTNSQRATNNGTGQTNVLYVPQLLRPAKLRVRRVNTAAQTGKLTRIVWSGRNINKND